MSGFCTAAARLGAPDTGLLSYGEVVDQGRRAPLSTSSLCICGRVPGLAPCMQMHGAMLGLPCHLKVRLKGCSC
jgi:hypothetical protein